MSLLFDEDYQTFNELGISYVEDEGQRFLVFKRYPLPENLYEQIHFDVASISGPSRENTKYSHL